MTQFIDLPDGTIGEFPDNMGAEQIEAVLTAQFPPGADVAQPGAQAPQEAGEPGFLSGLADDALGVLETGAQFATGAVAEPIAGLLGGVKTLTSGPEAGQETIEGFREALTFQPRSESGKAKSAAVGAFFEPVGNLLQKAEEFSGDLAADIGRITGSPTIEAFAGAFGATLPTAALEILGFKGAGRLAKRKGLKLKKKRTAEENAAILENAPTVSELKKVSRGVYKEIDEIGATVRPQSYENMLIRLDKDLRRAGFRPKIDKDVAEALKELKGNSGKNMSISDVDDLRQLGQGFASSLDPKTKSLGMQIINNIDDLLDRPNVLDLPKGTGPSVGERYRTARKFWAQAKKGETLEELRELATQGDRAATLTALQTRIRRLIRGNIENKGAGKFFTKRERLLMRQVADSDDVGNILTALSKLDPTNPKGGGFGTAFLPGAGLLTSAVTGGISPVLTGVAFPFIGRVARNTAEQLSLNNFKLATKIVKAGKDSRRVVRAYLDTVPKGQRNVNSLADLLKNPDIDLEAFKKGTTFTNQAISKAKELRRLQVLGAQQAPIALAQSQENELP